MTFTHRRILIRTQIGCSKIIPTKTSPRRTSTTLRLLQLWRALCTAWPLMSNVHTHVPLAEKSRITLSAPSSNSSASDSTSSQSTTATNSTVPGRTSTASAPSSTSTSPSTLDSSGPLQHFTSSGWLTPVVDPYSDQRTGDNQSRGRSIRIRNDSRLERLGGGGITGS
jgi:hypothetical protein